MPVLAQISRGRALWTVIKRKPLGMVSAALILAVVLTAIFANVLAPYDPLSAQPEIRLAPPSWASSVRHGRHRA
jgi:peptide/nickel transport system permease protein